MRYKVFALLLVVFLAGFRFTASGRVYLVAAGISDYPGTENDLRLPANDARVMAQLYSKNSNAEYRLFLDSRATTSVIISAMRSLYAKAGPDDIVVFFFSGHGYQGGFCTYDGYLNYDQIRKAMSASRSRNKMIFADACFSGKIRTPGKASANSLSSAKKANVMLFLSSRDDEVSYEKWEMKNGYFTTFLERGLKGSADANRDRTITAKELYLYVHDGVIRLSKNEQHPVMWGNFPDNMPVMKW